MGIVKRLAGFALCLAAAAALLPAFGTAAYADEIKYDVYVAGKQVTSTNAADVLNDGTASYDASTSTLTVKKSITYSVSGGSAIKTTGDNSLRIVVADGVAITSSGGPGILCENGDLTIDAEGDLTVSSGSADYAHGYAVRCPNGDLTINVEGKLTVSSAWFGITSLRAVSLVCGEGAVSSVESAIVGEEGVTVECGALDVTSTIGAGIDGWTKGPVVVKGGALTVKGKEAGIRGKSLSVASGTVDVRCTYGDSDANDGYKYAIKCGENGEGFDPAGLSVLAATEVDGKFEPYLASKFNLYDHVKIAPELETHDVTFDSKGGSAVAAQTVEDGGKVEKPADPTKEGYDFAGWTFEGKAWDFDSNMVTGDITLVAEWKEKDADGNDGGGEPGIPEGDDPSDEQPDADEPKKPEPNDGESDAEGTLAQTGDDAPFAGLLAVAAASGIAVLALRRRIA